MEYTMTYESGVGIATLKGKLDGEAAPGFEAWFAGAARGEVKSYLLDLEELTYITSAGLRVILKIAKETVGKDGRLALCSMNRPVNDVLLISGFKAFLEMFSSRAEAMDFLRKQE